MTSFWPLVGCPASPELSERPPTHGLICRSNVDASRLQKNKTLVAKIYLHITGGCTQNETFSEFCILSRHLNRFCPTGARFHARFLLVSPASYPAARSPTRSKSPLSALPRRTPGRSPLELPQRHWLGLGFWILFRNLKFKPLLSHSHSHSHVSRLSGLSCCTIYYSRMLLLAPAGAGAGDLKLGFLFLTRGMVEDRWVGS